MVCKRIKERNDMNNTICTDTGTHEPMFVYLPKHLEDAYEHLENVGEDLENVLVCFGSKPTPRCTWGPVPFESLRHLIANIYTCIISYQNNVHKTP